MSTNDWNQPWGQQPPPPPRQGMSTGTKVVIILLIIFGILFLLCCGGLILSGVYFGKYMENAVSEDPAAVRQATDGLLPQIKVPEPFQPQASMDIKIPFTDQRMMVMVFWTHKASDSALILGSFGEAFGQQNQDQMREAMEQNLRQQGLDPDPDRPGKWESTSESKEIEVRGQKVTFNFVRRKRVDAEESRIEVTGTVPGETGPVLLILNADTSVVNEEQAVQMLQSIR